MQQAGDNIESDAQIVNVTVSKFRWKPQNTSSPMKRNSAGIADKLRDAFRVINLRKNTVTLKPGLGVTEGHSKCHHSIHCMRPPIDVQ